MLVIYSFILPGNNLLPFAGVINLSLAVPAWIVTKGNVPRMLILCAIGAPVFLYVGTAIAPYMSCLLYTSPSPRDRTRSRMPSSA